MPMTPHAAALLAAALLCLWTLPAARAQADMDAQAVEDYSLAGLDRFDTAADLDTWFAGFRFHPTPERVPAAIVAYSEFGRLSAQRPLVILSAFFAEIIRNHPQDIEAWDATLRDGNEAERWLLWNAIWWSDTEGAKPFFKARLEGASARDTETLRYFIENDPVDLLTTDVDNELVMVTLVYSYFGGGNPLYLERMTLPLETPAMTVTEFQKGVSAKEELANSASRLMINYATTHHDILAFCQDKSVNGSEWVRKRMGRVLAGVAMERENREIQPDPIIARPLPTEEVKTFDRDPNTHPPETGPDEEGDGGQ